MFLVLCNRLLATWKACYAFAPVHCRQPVAGAHAAVLLLLLSRPWPSSCHRACQGGAGQTAPHLHTAAAAVGDGIAVMHGREAFRASLQGNDAPVSGKLPTKRLSHCTQQLHTHQQWGDQPPPQPPPPDAAWPAAGPARPAAPLRPHRPVAAASAGAAHPAGGCAPRHEPAGCGTQTCSSTGHTHRQQGNMCYGCVMADCTQSYVRGSLSERCRSECLFRTTHTGSTALSLQDLLSAYISHPVQLAVIATGQPLVGQHCSSGNVQLGQHVVLPEVGAAAQRRVGVGRAAGRVKQLQGRGGGQKAEDKQDRW